MNMKHMNTNESLQASLEHTVSCKTTFLGAKMSESLRASLKTKLQDNLHTYYNE